MHEDKKRFLRIFMVIVGLAITLWIFLKRPDKTEILELGTFPTLVFLPTMFLINKFKLFEIGHFSKKYSQWFYVVGLVIGILTAPKISFKLSMYSCVYGFEIACFYYWTLVQEEKHIAMNCGNQ